jgi:nucleoside 2-deoxyribosyltransferase
MLKVYVAGAYSAPNVIAVLDNMRRGMQLSYKVIKAGFAPFVPWFDYQFSLIGEMKLEEYYAYSIAWLEVSDAVLVVPDGADKSKGTQAEIALANKLGIPVFWSLEVLKAWSKTQCRT